MTDVRDILRRALPDAVPLPITRESAVAAGRRAVRRRRIRLSVVGVGAATAVVLAGAGVLAGGGTRAASTAVAGAGTVVSTPPSAVRPPVQRRLTEPASQATARLTAALRAAVHPLLAPSVLHPVSMPSVNGTSTYRPLEVARFEGGIYMGFAQVRDAQGTGSLDFHLNPYLGDNPERRDARSCAEMRPPGPSCETRIGPGGELIIVEVGHPAPSSPVTEYRVEVVKADGTALVSVARNVGDTIDLDRGPAERTEPPLTVDQMIAILLGPGLTLYP